MSRSTSVAAMPDVDAIMELFLGQLQNSRDFALHCPRSASSRGVVSCTYHTRVVRACENCKMYSQLPVSGRRMQRFLRFRLSCHALPNVAGRPS